MSTSIRLRACLAVIESDKILLVAHYNTDAGAVQWLIPGGGVEFGKTKFKNVTHSDGVAIRYEFQQTFQDHQVLSLNG